MVLWQATLEGVKAGTNEAVRSFKKRPSSEHAEGANEVAAGLEAAIQSQFVDLSEELAAK